MQSSTLLTIVSMNGCYATLTYIHTELEWFVWASPPAPPPQGAYIHIAVMAEFLELEPNAPCYIHMYIHTYIHIYIHTYIHTYT